MAKLIGETLLICSRLALRCMFSPLEQFEVVVLVPITWHGFDFSVTSLGYSLHFVGSGLIGFFLVSLLRPGLIPTYGQYFVEVIYDFFWDMLVQQVGRGNLANVYFPLIFVVFFIILACNLTGLIVYTFTLTAQLMFTLWFSFAFNLSFIVYAVWTFGRGFIDFFMPKGLPSVLVPFVFVIEIISYCIRPFSLAIRLFVNLMAGHILLYIGASFVTSILAFWLFFPLVLAIYVLEFMIAFIQSYVFAVLLCIYLNDVLTI